MKKKLIPTALLLVISATHCSSDADKADKHERVMSKVFSAIRNEKPDKILSALDEYAKLDRDAFDEHARSIDIDPAMFAGLRKHASIGEKFQLLPAIGTYLPNVPLEIYYNTYMLKHGDTIKDEYFLRQELGRAIHDGDWVAIQKNLVLGANPNSYDEHGETPLTHVIKKSSEYPSGKSGLTRHVIDKLANKGANLNLPNKHGEKPLFLALERKAHLAKQLLDRGASANVYNQDGVHASEVAEQRGYTNLIPKFS